MTVKWKVFWGVAIVATAIVFGKDFLQWMMAPPSPVVEKTNEVEPSTKAPPRPASLPTVYIRPGQIERFKTDKRNVGFESSGIVSMRLVVFDKNGVEHHHPAGVDPDKDGWTTTPTADSVVKIDLLLCKVADYLEVCVPRNCPPSTFKLIFRD